MLRSVFVKKWGQEPTKAQIVEKLMRSVKGASLDEIVEATGWQAHSCRAFLSGLRKRGHNIIRAKRKDYITFYRIAKAAMTNQASTKTSEKTEEPKYQETA